MNKLMVQSHLPIKRFAMACLFEKVGQSLPAGASIRCDGHRAVLLWGQERVEMGAMGENSDGGCGGWI